MNNREMLVLLRRIANYEPRLKKYRPNKALFREPVETPDNSLPEASFLQSDIDFLMYREYIELQSNAIEVFFQSEDEIPVDIVERYYLTPKGKELLLKGEIWEMNMQNKNRASHSAAPKIAKNPISELENMGVRQ